MRNAFICGSDFYFIDFYISINLFVLSDADPVNMTLSSTDELPPFTKLTQLIKVLASNDYSNISIDIEI